MNVIARGIISDGRELWSHNNFRSACMSRDETEFMASDTRNVQAAHACFIVPFVFVPVFEAAKTFPCN